MKYDRAIITIPPIIGLQDCCFLPYMKYPKPIEPQTSEAKRKPVLNISAIRMPPKADRVRLKLRVGHSICSPGVIDYDAPGTIWLAAKDICGFSGQFHRLAVWRGSSERPNPRYER
jgi:hypothetical protein